MKTLLTRSSPTRQKGVLAVEFAIVSIVFFLLLMGIIEWGRILFYWNTMVEATRSATRTAVVCDLNDAAIKRRITTLLPFIPEASIGVTYLPDGCSASAAPICQMVTVSIKPDVVVDTFIPFVSFSSITMPKFSTTLTTESLQSSPGGLANPTCPKPIP